MDRTRMAEILTEEAKMRGFTAEQTKEYVAAGVKWWEEKGEKPEKPSAWSSSKFSSDR